MAIPEHDKCVKMWKRIRCRRHHGIWKTVRESMRRMGRMKPRDRVRTKFKAARMINRVTLPKRIGKPSYTEFRKELYGPHYRRWDKYDD